MYWFNSTGHALEIVWELLLICVQYYCKKLHYKFSLPLLHVIIRNTLDFKESVVIGWAGSKRIMIHQWRNSGNLMRSQSRVAVIVPIGGGSRISWDMPLVRSNHCHSWTNPRNIKSRGCLPSHLSPSLWIESYIRRSGSCDVIICLTWR